MDEQRTIELRAPVNRALLSDPAAVERLIETMLAEAAQKILESNGMRACRLDGVRFDVENDETTWMRPGHGIGVLRLTYTPDAPPE